MDKDTLVKLHEDVPAWHYDRGIKQNILQHFWHSQRFSNVLKVVKPATGSILDVGCHGGLFTQKIVNKSQARDVYGVDISPTAISLATQRIPFGKFAIADAHKLPFKDNFFSTVYCLEMLEHVDDPVKVLSEIKRVLKNGGVAVLLIPTDNKLFQLIWFLWNLVYPVWKHVHVQSFQRKDLEKTLERLKFTNIESKTFLLGMLKLTTCEKH